MRRISNIEPLQCNIVYTGDYKCLGEVNILLYHLCCLGYKGELGYIAVSSLDSINCIIATRFMYHMAGNFRG